MKTRTDERKLSDRIGIKPESRVVVSMTELSQLEYQPQRSAKKSLLYNFVVKAKLIPLP